MAVRADTLAQHTVQCQQTFSLTILLITALGRSVMGPAPPSKFVMGWGVQTKPTAVGAESCQLHLCFCKLNALAAPPFSMNWGIPDTTCWVGKLPTALQLLISRSFTNALIATPPQTAFNGTGGVQNVVNKTCWAGSSTLTCKLSHTTKEISSALPLRIRAQPN